MMNQQKKDIYERATHKIGQWATFFCPLVEGAQLKGRNVHQVYKVNLWASHTTATAQQLVLTITI